MFSDNESAERVKTYDFGAIINSNFPLKDLGLRLYDTHNKEVRTSCLDFGDDGTRSHILLRALYAPLEFPEVTEHLLEMHLMLSCTRRSGRGGGCCILIPFDDALPMFCFHIS